MRFLATINRQRLSLAANGAVNLQCPDNWQRHQFADRRHVVEVGAVATPFNRQSLAKSMADCQRYYEVGSQAIFSGNVTSGSSFYINERFKANKRASPTIVYNDQGSQSFPAGVPNAIPAVDCLMSAKVANATGVGFYQFGWTASAEL